MNIFEPPTSYYILSGQIEKEIIPKLTTIFETHKDIEHPISQYNDFLSFLHEITSHIDDYVTYKGEQKQLNDIIQNSQLQVLREILDQEGINFNLKLENTRLLAEKITIELPSAGLLKFNPVDVTETLNQYIVYSKMDLDLPFNFNISISSYYPENNYFSTDTPKFGYGLLFEMLLHVNQKEIEDKGIDLNLINTQVNKLLDRIAEEILIDLHNENISILLRSLSIVEVENT